MLVLRNFNFILFDLLVCSTQITLHLLPMFPVADGLWLLFNRALVNLRLLLLIKNVRNCELRSGKGFGAWKISGRVNTVLHHWHYGYLYK